MLLNSDHFPWIAGTVVATTVAAIAYGSYVSSSPYGPSGGSWPGLLFGVTGTSLMVATGLLSLRKKLLIWRLGSARLWMQMHIWFGVLTVPLILFHSGFGLGGPLTTALMVLFYVVIASGVFGLILQQFLPAMMTARVPLETIYSQIDHVTFGLAVDAYEQVASVAGAIPEAAEEQARLAAEEARQKACPGDWKQVGRLSPAGEPAPGAAALRAFYLSAIRPYLRRAKLSAGTLPDFRRIRLEGPADWRGQLEKLQQICEESRQLGIQVKLHGWLHNWLFIHAPLSFALFVLVALHISLALQY